MMVLRARKRKEMRKEGRNGSEEIFLVRVFSIKSFFLSVIGNRRVSE